MRVHQSNRAGKQFTNNPRAGDRGQGRASPSNAKSYDRYVTLAREATQRGDAIEAENLYQHAEHYFRQMRDRSVA